MAKTTLFTHKMALLQILRINPSWPDQIANEVRKKTGMPVSRASANLTLYLLEYDGLVRRYPDKTGPSTPSGRWPSERRPPRTRQLWKLTAKGAREAQRHRQIAASLFELAIPETPSRESATHEGSTAKRRGPRATAK